MKSAFWTALRTAAVRYSSPLITLLKYGLGFSLLAYIITDNWSGAPGKVTADQAALSVVAGGAVDVQARQLGATPGLRDVFSQPIDPRPLALACVLWTVSLLITFFRWYVLVRAQDLPFTKRNALRLGLVSYFFNTFLPGSVGGDIVKAVALAREQSRRAVAVATIIIDRVIGLWALAWLVALSGGVFWVTGNPYLVHNAALKTIVAITAALVVGSAVVWSLMGLPSTSRSEVVALRFERIPTVGKTVAELWRAGWLYRRKKKAVAAALGMTLVSHAGWIVIFHLCVSAFPEVDSATLPEHVLIVPVGITAQAMFPLPGGVGGGEAAYGWLYTLVGKAAVGGIIGCLVMRIIAWGIGLIGYFIFLAMRKELPVAVPPTPIGRPAV